MTEHRFIWFSGHTVQRIADRLAMYGPENARIEFHPHGESFLVFVKPNGPQAAALTATCGDGCDEPLNDAHICPIDCPGGGG